MSFISSLGEWLRKVSKSFMSATISGKTITFTRHNGDTVTLTTQDTTYELASQSTSGLMSSIDKQKLDAIPSDAVFTDTVTTVSVTGSGNAITDITANNGALTAEKNQTFSLSNHAHSEYVQKTGDTMSGALIVNAPIYAPFHIFNTVNTGELQVHGGTGWHGGILTLHGKDQPNLKGYFRLFAHDGTNSSMLEGQPNGELTWRGNQVITLVDTVTTSKNGLMLADDKLKLDNAITKKARTQGTITVNSTNVSASYSGYYYANGIGSATICILIADNSDTQTVWKNYPIMTLSPAPKLVTRFVFVSQETGLGVTVTVDTTGLVTLDQKNTTFNNKWLWGGLTFPVDA